MTAAAHPFTDPDLVRAQLYASAGRLARRTGALHRARVSGQHAGEVIADLAAAATAAGSPRVADLGCGRGTTTRMLAARLPAATVAAVDLSAAMLASVEDRLGPFAERVMLVQADFHCLPFGTGMFDAIVAAFCLYHSARPEHVVAEITRCLQPGGTAIFAVKSLDSYRELDELIADAGIDPGAVSRPSLYQTAHSGNVTTLAAGRLSIRQVIHHTHRFTFQSLAEAAAYLITSPKYQLLVEVGDDPEALAAALQRRVAERPVTTTSIVTYLSASKPAASAQ